MWISSRAATRILTGVVSGEAQARAVLTAGLAGRPLLDTRPPLYDEAAVQALVARPIVDLVSATGSARVAQLCPYGLYVARLRRGQPLDLTAPWEDTARSLATIPQMPAMTAGLLAARIQSCGRLPWVATLCGFVAVGGDITGTTARPEGDPPGRAFVLEPPGSWFATLAGARLPSGPGGRPWLVWLPPRE